MKRILYWLVCLGTLAWRASGDTVQPLGEPWQTLAIVSGFHNFVDKANNMNVRVLEANGDTTVATNPVALYFVVTNNSSAGDLQEHVWRLPFRVKRVLGVEQVRSGLRITAVSDTSGPTNGERRVKISVLYSVHESILAKDLEVKER